VKITHAIGIIVGAGTAITSLAVDGTKVKVDVKAEHMTAKLGVLRARISIKSVLAAAKSTLQGRHQASFANLHADLAAAVGTKMAPS
jgi:hypothetical protein